MKLSHLIAVLTCVIALLGPRAHAQDSTQTAPSDLSQTALETSRTLAAQSELASIAKAQEVRSALLTTPPADAATCEQLRTELRKLVLDAFLARHELQVMEVKSLLRKAQQMQTKLEQRQANHASIIDRRMEELLNPDLDWDAELAIAQQPTSPESSSNQTDTANWLERLQGKWDLTIHYLWNQESKSDSYTAAIVGSQFRIAKPDGTGGFTPQELQFLEGTTPQQLDMRSVFSHDELAEISGKQGLVLAVSTMTPAIIEQTGETIRICATTGINQSRPDQFAVRVNTCIYELRRPTGSDDQSAASHQTFDTPQELLAFMIKCSESSDYEGYVSLLTDGAARDLAGMLLLGANTMAAQIELVTNEHGAAAAVQMVTPATQTVQEVLARWSKPNPTAEQREVLGNSLSTALTMAFSGTGPDPSAIGAYLQSIRRLAELITDHRQFAVEMMQAFSQVGSSYPIFGNSGQTLTSQVQEEAGDLATVTIAAWDKTPATGSSGQSYTPMSITKIQLRRIDGHWLISNLLDESHAALFETSPPLSTTESTPSEFRLSSNSPPYDSDFRTAGSSSNPSGSTAGLDAVGSSTDAAIISKSYRVANMVTEPLFSSSAFCEQKEEFAKHEIAIEKEMISLVETIKTACSQPPKYMQTIVSSRNLLVGHTESGHREIEQLFSQLKVSTNERIRLQYALVSPNSLAAGGIDFDIESGSSLTSEQAQKIWNKVTEAPETETSLVSPENIIWPGEKVSLASGMISVTARIVPGTRIVQIRMLHVGTDEDDPDPQCYPTTKKVEDGQVANFPFLNYRFLVKAEILNEEPSQNSSTMNHSDGTEFPNDARPLDATASPSLAYSGKPVTYWLDAYWTASTPNEKTEATNGARLTSMMAIAEFRERPECDETILQAMSKWSTSVDNELSPNRLSDVADCIMHVGGKRHYLHALEHLFKIADRMPAESAMDWFSIKFLLTICVTDGHGDFTLKEEFKNLSITDELFTLLAKNLSSGTSKQRLFAYVLLMAIGRDEETRDDKSKTVREAWQKEESIVLEPAFLAASEDENEEVRSLSALFLAHLLHKNPVVRERLIAMIESDPSSTVRCYAISSIADVASAADSAEANPLSNELVSCLTKAVRNDSSNDVKSTALNALTQRGLENELVHQTLMEWARSEDPKIVNLAMDSLYNGSTNGKRPQSVDELMELLSDSAWGIKIEVNRNNFSKHHRWARQYAIAVLGQYDSMALSVLPILETELANKETAKFAREAIDRISGYCSDLPVKSLQGKWRVAVGVSPAGHTEVSPLLPLKAGAEEADRIVEITGTQLLKDGKCIGQISHARGSSQQVVQIVIVGESEQLRLSGSISPEDDGTVRDQYQLRLRKVSNSAQQNAREDLYELHRVESEVSWSDFLQQLPEAGTALVMVDDQSETSRSMQPIAKQVADAASVQLVTLPLSQWPGMFTPSATHFVLMKDRQLVGTRSGLMTGQRLHDFVDIAAGWLTPQATGVKENSLVRIDCYINPGKNNIGSQHGGTYPLTTAVVAVYEDQALLLGPDGIAGYIEKGYACVAIVYDESGREKQLPLDVVQIGPVKLIGQDGKTSQSAIEAKTAFEEGSVTSDPELARYLKSATEPLEAYDTGRAIYHIRGAHGLTPVTLAAADYLPTTDQPVLSASVKRDRYRE